MGQAMAEIPNYPRVAQFRDAAALHARLAELGQQLPIDEDVLTAVDGSPLAQPITVGKVTVGNRWCIHPMEGWDANHDGSPTQHTLRRWRNFGASGAKLIWGGEAAAVRSDGRANPNQTLATESNRAGLARLLAELQSAHLERFGSLDGLVVGLQLTHSGRFCKPHDHDRFEPLIAYHHPLLDAKYKIDPQNETVVLTDLQVDRLIDDFVAAARLAHDVGFQFVDVKACHGYLLHEFLSARRRRGRFGGDLAGRSRLLITVIERIREEIPQLMTGVRLSAFDSVPYAGGRQLGQPMDFTGQLPYDCGFGISAQDPTQIDLTEPLELVRMLVECGVVAINVTCGSPYYNPHLQRPAIFPPTDGYLPPEDPLVGVCRQIHTTRKVKQVFPNVPIAGTGYSYLQEFLPHVAQAAVRGNWTDFVGLGRMVLSYPELPADVLAGRPLERKRICRTFSDCTTAPRNGLVSGCYPLDPYYKSLPERQQLIDIKVRWK
jgi:2,4-dienoyl-CoA reductase-like NADH-dependent reductase (Old Yellow Enzyme family)